MKNKYNSNKGLYFVAFNRSFNGIIIILILECVISSHKSPSMYQNSKTVSNYVPC